jgi:hypothetical protein
MSENRGMITNCNELFRNQFAGRAYGRRTFGGFIMKAHAFCLFFALFGAACASEVAEVRSPATEAERRPSLDCALEDSASRNAPSASAHGKVRLPGDARSAFALARREAGTIAVWAEAADGTLNASVARVQARHVIGDVSIAASGDRVLVVWAQGEPTGCTSLFGFTWRVGEAALEPRRIGEKCNEESSARSPTAVAAEAGRFVVVFTELGVWSSRRESMMVDEDAVSHARFACRYGEIAPGSIVEKRRTPSLAGAGS